MPHTPWGESPTQTYRHSWPLYEDGCRWDPCLCPYLHTPLNCTESLRNHHRGQKVCRTHSSPKLSSLNVCELQQKKKKSNFLLIFVSIRKKKVSIFKTRNHLFCCWLVLFLLVLFLFVLLRKRSPLCRPGQSQTSPNLPASASPEKGFQARVTTASQLSIA